MLRDILIWPDQRLHQKSAEIEIDKIDQYDTLIKDMWETMYYAGGIGLAAIQIGIPVQLFVMDAYKQYVCINPKITALVGQPELKNEGCLSLPGIVESVARHEIIGVEYFDQTGAKIVQQFSGLEAQCFAHEEEHTRGMIIPDKLSPLARSHLVRKMDKYKRNKTP